MHLTLRFRFRKNIITCTATQIPPQVSKTIKGLSRIMTEKDNEDARRVYAMVTNIDDNVGRLLKKLQDLNIAENTVVIFMTDNGPQQRRYNAGMRGLKSSVYRGGVRVPFWIRYPALKRSNFEIEATAANIDVLPTLADICNVKVPAGRKIDGISLIPYIKGKKEEDEPVIILLLDKALSGIV